MAIDDQTRVGGPVDDEGATTQAERAEYEREFWEDVSCKLHAADCELLVAHLAVSGNGRQTYGQEVEPVRCLLDLAAACVDKAHHIACERAKGSGNEIPLSAPKTRSSTVTDTER